MQNTHNYLIYTSNDSLCYMFAYVSGQVEKT